MFFIKNCLDKFTLGQRELELTLTWLLSIHLGLIKQVILVHNFGFNANYVIVGHRPLHPPP